MSVSRPPLATFAEDAASLPEVIELTLLLATSQAVLLEREAYRRGQTLAELIRSILHEFFQRPSRRPR